MCLLTYDMYLIPIYQIYFNKTIHALKAVVVFSFINNPALVFSFIDVSFIILKFIRNINKKKRPSWVMEKRNSTTTAFNA